jgi:hypothetical protein
VAIPAHFPLLTRLTLSTVFAWGCLGRAQEPQTPSSQPPLSDVNSQAQPSAPRPCVQPAPLPSWQDYNGKLSKLVGAFARKLERKSVHPPHYKPGVVLCTLETKDKFFLFVQDAIDPVTFLGAGFNAGISQAANDDPSFGQGAAGYGKRFGANLADQAVGEFFKDFTYPVLFEEDPRYYRLVHGSRGKRLLHAIDHAFVAHREDGTHMFNYSQWLGTATSALLSNTYHPDSQRGVAPFARRMGFGVLTDMGYDVLREFWPEISRKLKLPFRGEPIVETPVPAPTFR